MKYVSKTLLVKPEPQKETFKDSELVRFHKKEADHFRLFQAIKWFMNRHDNDFKGIRTFQPSQLLGRVISLAYDSAASDVIWTAVHLVIWGEKFLIRENDKPVEVERLPIPESPFI